MIAQIPDQVYRHCNYYTLAGIKGEGLFDPEQYGLKPQKRFDACQRGYACTYVVGDGHIFLYQLELGIDGDPPELFGERPTIKRSEMRIYDAVYKGFLHPIEYSGGLLCAKDLIEKLFVNMGYQPAWKYLEVQEFIFLGGKLVNIIDRSEKMAKIRMMKRKKKYKPSIKKNPKEYYDWVEKSFSLEYR